MCGIVGYIGKSDATGILIEGLRRLEYRGYDSAGVTVAENGGLRTVKTEGRLDALEQRLREEGRPAGHCGIGHTRWATHGEPSDRNAHPHQTGKLSLVHNGIIENYLSLRQFLTEEGCAFRSETDTESAALLLDHYYEGDPLPAIWQMTSRLRGSYAFGVLFADRPEEIYALRKDSPLIVGVAEDGAFLASDIPAILRHTNRYYLLEEGEIARLRADGVTIFDPEGRPVEKELQTADWDVSAAEKGGYAHFMLKEIHEQPRALRDTIGPRVRDGLPVFEDLPDEVLAQAGRIYFVACGTAYHAGLMGKAALERLAGIPVEADLASEFRYREPILRPDDVAVFITQSGETADTLAALRLAKSRGLRTVAIANVIASSIPREADHVIYTNAGPEIAVASTKAYSVQLAVIYLLAIRAGLLRGGIGKERARALTAALEKTPALVEQVLRDTSHVQSVAAACQTAHDLFYIGRGLDYALAMEGSLKLKEISYIHSEAYAAGELKHGTISLCTEGVPVFALATQSALYEKMLGNIREVASRGARVLLMCMEGAPNADQIGDYVLELPAGEELFAAIPGVTVLQLFAYYAALARGCDVDKPRNLAKSVTVE